MTLEEIKIIERGARIFYDQPNCLKIIGEWVSKDLCDPAFHPKVCSEAIFLISKDVSLDRVVGMMDRIRADYQRKYLTTMKYKGRIVSVPPDFV